MKHLAFLSILEGVLFVAPLKDNETSPPRSPYKPLLSPIAHIDAFLISVLRKLLICPVNTCKLQHYLLEGFIELQAQKKKAQEFVVLKGRTELNAFSLEENKIINIRSWHARCLQQQSAARFQRD